VASSKNEKVKFLTNPDIGVQKKLLSNAIKQVSGGEVVKATCLGLPGMFDSKKIINLPNIPTYNNYKISDLIEVENIFVKNDAVLAGLAEAVDGAGKGYNRVAYLTLGTGVGGSLIVSGVAKNMEPGNEFFSDGETFENHVSGRAFERIYRASSKNCEDINVWKEYAKDLTTGIKKIILPWKPDVIVIGGGVANRFEKFSSSFIDIPVPIKKSKFMDRAGLMGGLFFLMC